MIFIANRDRAKRNIRVGSPTDVNEIRLIDHERSLFYVYPDEGEQSLASRVDRFGITDSTESDTDGHCLLEWIEDASLMGKWIERVQSIPPWYIKEVCSDVLKLPITKSEHKAVVEFLLERKHNLSKLILENKHRFPMVKQWPFL